MGLIMKVRRQKTGGSDHRPALAPSLVAVQATDRDAVTMRVTSHVATGRNVGSTAGSVTIDDPLLVAVLKTIAYSDIFDFPLEATEVHSYLIGKCAALPEVCNALDRLSMDGMLSRHGVYFQLVNRSDLSPLRRTGEANAIRLLTIARRLTPILSNAPFVRMVVVSGSVAAMNASPDADLDLMLLVQPGRIYFVLALFRLLRRSGV